MGIVINFITHLVLLDDNVAMFCSKCVCLVESAHCWEIEGGVTSLDGAVGGVVVGRAWSGCCGIYNKTQSDI